MERELGPHLDALSAKFESWLAPKPIWSSTKMTAGRLDAMKKAIVGLVMSVDEIEGSFKLNQHIRRRLCGHCHGIGIATRSGGATACAHDAPDATAGLCEHDDTIECYGHA